jgi:predicted translin family RNA/ssDNA-binding protein
VATAQSLKKSFEAMLEGEDDEDNKVAREAIRSLEAYVVESKPVLDAVQNGAFDTAKVADKRLDKAKAHVTAVEKHIEQIGKIVRDEVKDRQAEFADAMTTTLYAFAARSASRWCWWCR